MDDFIPYHTKGPSPLWRRVFYALVFTAAILATAHFSYQTGVRHGVEAAVEYLLSPAPPATPQKSELRRI